MYEKERADAKAAGYTDDEINQYIASLPKQSFIEQKKTEANTSFDQNNKDQSTNILGAQIPNSLLIPAAVGTAGMLAGAAYKANKGAAPPPERIDPTLNSVNSGDALPPMQVNPPALPPETPVIPNAAVPNATTDLQAKLEAIKQATQGAAPITSQVVTPAVEPVVQPVVSAETPTPNPAPSTTPAVVEAPASTNLGQINDPKISPVTETGELKVPDVLQPAGSTSEPVITKKAKVGSPTKEALAASEAARAASDAIAPEGFRTQYPKNKTNPIGPGGYNWVAGQEGGVKAPSTWKDLVGEKNMSYNDFMEQKKPFFESYAGGDPDAFKYPASPAKYEKPSYIPKFIKGAATPGFLGALAAGTLAGTAMLNATAKQKREIAGETAMGIAPPVLQGLTYSGNAGDPNEAALVNQRMVGGGRGYVNPPQGGPIDPKAEWEKMRKVGLVFTRF